MPTVSDFAEEFAARARKGTRTTVRVNRQHAQSFFAVLAREGFEFARSCLDQIQDPELRRIIETLFYSTLGGAGLGAAIGGAVGGVPGAQVGAAVGAASGLVIGIVAIVLTAKEDGDEVIITANALKST